MAVIVLRGIPGAGKSTWVEAHAAEATVVSADHFFVDGGVYRFDPARLPEAHAECLRRFVAAVADPSTTLVVDNTSISVAEVAPYAALAIAFGHDLRIVTIIADPAKAAARNVHGVPAHVVESMATRLAWEGERFPPWWPQEKVAAAWDP